MLRAVLSKPQSAIGLRSRSEEAPGIPPLVARRGVLDWYPGEYDRDALVAAGVGYIAGRHTAGTYPEPRIRELVSTAIGLCEAFAPVRLRGREGAPSPLILLGQICHETANLNFGGDVAWDQHNFSGLGAIDGAPGHAFPSIYKGVLATFLHHYAYVNGRWETWSPGPRTLLRRDPKTGALTDPRYPVIARMGWTGTVRIVRDYGGRWAPSPVYAEGIVRHANRIVARYDEGRRAPWD